MNPRNSTGNHSIVAGIAALAVTTVLVSTLVGSFDPAQLLRIDESAATAQVAAVDARREALTREA